jgi:hypothetical protein
MVQSEFKNKKATQNLSDYMTVGEEAFLVLAYCNSYDAWKFEAAKDPDDDGVSIHPEHPCPPRRFTNDSKGADRYKGWSEEGLQLHTEICKKLEIQRADKTDPRLKEFEQNLKERFAQSSGQRNPRRRTERTLELYNQLDMDFISKRLRLA